MPSGAFFALLDDVIAQTSKIAATSLSRTGKVAGVVIDDTAVTAETVTGIPQERELPVVIKIAKASAVNKVILGTIAVVCSIFAPVLITLGLVAGGIYLSYEGWHKALSWFKKDKHHGHAPSEKKSDKPSVFKKIYDGAKTLPLLGGALKSLEKYVDNYLGAPPERDIIRSAVITDVVLSAEIIAIGYASILTASLPLWGSVAALAGLAAITTVGVYGVVGGILKLDNIGEHFMKAEGKTLGDQLSRGAGRMIVAGAPGLLKAISVFGTIAMCSVGGAIIAHNVFPALSHAVEAFAHSLHWLSWPTEFAAGAVMGVVFGVIADGAAKAGKAVTDLFKKKNKSADKPVKAETARSYILMPESMPLPIPKAVVNPVPQTKAEPPKGGPASDLSQR